MGTAICGASAIAAISSVIRAKDESISVSLGVVFILNAIALLFFPMIGQALGLTQDQFGWWAGLAIHDTSSVVGATMQYGERALEIGTTIKLARALWIIPLAILFAKFYPHEENKTDSPKQYPWFIAGFVLVSALVTALPVLQPYGQYAEMIAKKTMVAAIFLIGTGLTLATLKAVGAKTLFQGLGLWLFVSLTSLMVVMYF